MVISFSSASQMDGSNHACPEFSTSGETTPTGSSATSVTLQALTPTTGMSSRISTGQMTPGSTGTFDTYMSTPGTVQYTPDVSVTDSLMGDDTPGTVCSIDDHAHNIDEEVISKKLYEANLARVRSLSVAQSPYVQAIAKIYKQLIDSDDMDVIQDFMPNFAYDVENFSLACLHPVSSRMDRQLGDGASELYVNATNLLKQNLKLNEHTHHKYFEFYSVSALHDFLHFETARHRCSATDVIHGDQKGYTKKVPEDIYTFGISLAGYDLNETVRIVHAVNHGLPSYEHSMSHDHSPRALLWSCTATRQKRS